MIRIVVDRAQVGHREGYHLSIGSEGIELIGGSPAGCFYGLQTLHQLTDFQEGIVANAEIVDHPDFDSRGLLHDVTRGKAPTLDTLKRLVDRLCRWKVNQLQLYIEHAFVFTFDSKICGPQEGLTPQEVGELDRYCRERFIDLVPALATFGHMGRILSMPAYRHLAEVEATKSWLEMSWPERMRGLTLDCMNPDAHRLVERMWSDVLDAFSSPIVNLCGDEPWDLGQGRNRGRFSTVSRQMAYLDEIRRTYDYCSARNRCVQAWSDVIRNVPDWREQWPDDMTVLHWDYDEQPDASATAAFVEAGTRTHVCPTTYGFKRIMNAMALAERNIAGFAAAGFACGAKGLLNTDWGDLGHVNPLACSWHGIALGAALGWRADHPTGEEFDRRFARAIWGVEGQAGLPLLRGAAKPANRCETWRLFCTPMRTACNDRSLPARAEAAESRHSANAFRRWVKSAANSNRLDDHDVAELDVACLISELFADRVEMLRRSKTDGRVPGDVTTGQRRWAEGVKEAAARYAECWRVRNKPSGLDDVLGALQNAAEDL